MAPPIATVRRFGFADEAGEVVLIQPSRSVPNGGKLF